MDKPLKLKLTNPLCGHDAEMVVTSLQELFRPDTPDGFVEAQGYCEQCKNPMREYWSVSKWQFHQWKYVK